MDISRRGFLQGTATAIAAVPFIKASHLMNVWTPKPEIFTGYGAPKIVTDVNSVNFTLQGLVPGCQVMVRNELTGEVLINELIHTYKKGWNVSENSGGVPLQVYIRKPGYKPSVHTIGSPYPGCKSKLVGIQLIQDLAHL